jgi:hypothetical protein
MLRNFIKQFTLLFLFSISYCSLVSQTLPSKLTDALLKDKSPQEITFLPNGYQFMSIPNENKEQNNVQIFKHRGGIWFAIEGTNRLYKLDSGNQITRQDNTPFGGYNFGANIFSYKDTIYSSGGYGFWSITGSIRFFNENTKEWDICRNIDNIPFANGLNAITYFDASKGKLYVLYNKSHPEYEKVKLTDDNLYFQCFDFNTKSWLDNPPMVNPKFAEHFNQISHVQKFNKGLLINSNKINGTVFLDFDSNKIFKIDDKFFTELIQTFNINKSGIKYISENKIKIYNFLNDSISEIILNEKVLKPIDVPILLPLKNILINKIENNFIYYLLLSVVLILIIIIVYLYVRLRKSKVVAFNFNAVDNNDTPHEFKKAKDFVDNLSNLEKELLHAIVKNNLDGNKTSVTQINKVLGTEKKSFKIQNNIRGEMLTLINNKFKAFSLINDYLIERQRSEFDKRHMEYFMNEKYIHKFPLKLFL